LANGNTCQINLTEAVFVNQPQEWRMSGANEDGEIKL